MAEVISILIADDNIDFGDLLEKYINRESDLKVAGVARDGLEAVNKIISLSPDVVILDLIMPNLDGIGVLEKLSTIYLNPRPVFIMLTAIGQDLFIKKAISLGAEYYLVKPFDAAVLVNRVRQFAKERGNGIQLKNCNFNTDEAPFKSSKPAGAEHRVTELMHRIGIPPHLAGYKYLREAVLYSVSNSSSICPVTKIIYPEVAKKFSTTPQKVERAIRSAIESTWTKNSPEELMNFIVARKSNRKRRPTNSEFIALMVDKIRIDCVDN